MNKYGNLLKVHTRPGIGKPLIHFILMMYFVPMTGVFRLARNTRMTSEAIMRDRVIVKPLSTLLWKEEPIKKMWVTK